MGIQCCINFIILVILLPKTDKQGCEFCWFCFARTEFGAFVAHCALNHGWYCSHVFFARTLSGKRNAHRNVHCEHHIFNMLNQFFEDLHFITAYNAEFRSRSAVFFSTGRKLGFVSCSVYAAVERNYMRQKYCIRSSVRNMKMSAKLMRHAVIYTKRAAAERNSCQT